MMPLDQHPDAATIRELLASLAEYDLGTALTRAQRAAIVGQWLSECPGPMRLHNAPRSLVSRYEIALYLRVVHL